MKSRRILAGAAALLVALVLVAPEEADAAKKRRKKRGGSRPIPVTPRPYDPYEVRFPSTDGVSLAATWRPVPGKPDAPAVLLLHEFSRDRRQWEGVMPELVERGMAALALDLRAHGESTRKGGARVKLVPRLQTDPNGFPRDVEAACRWLRERAPRLGVMGLSVGGNLAVIATASGWAEAGVALSAETERLTRLAGSRPRKPRATLLIASEEAPGRAAAARALHDAEETPRKLIIVPGAAHNLTLFTEHPETKDAAYAWLSERLGAPPPPQPETP